MKPSLGAGTLLELLEVDVSIFIIENPPSSSAGTLLHDIKHAISSEAVCTAERRPDVFPLLIDLKEVSICILYLFPLS